MALLGKSSGSGSNAHYWHILAIGNKIIRHVPFSVVCLFVLLILWGLSGCEQPTNSHDEDTPTHTRILTGQVLLENQAEHSNALVYIDSLDRGVSSDSSGQFLFQFNEEDTIYSGIFTIFYYLEDYDLDSAFFLLDKGEVKLDTMNVDVDGALPPVEMKQLLRVQGWTDREQYRVGDTLSFTARWTNVSNRIVPLYLWNVSSLGDVWIYRDKNYPGFSFGPLVGLETEGITLLSPGEYYEGSDDWNRVPEGTYTRRWVNSTVVDSFWVLEPAEYLVVTDFEIVIVTDCCHYSRISKTMRDFIWFEWETMHRGPSPRYDRKPNKFEFPHILIIEL